MTINIEKQINYWIKSAEFDLAAAEDMLIRKHYTWCLFVGHLIIEKALKAIFIKNNKKIPPRVHDLLMLAKLAKLTLTNEQEEFFSRVNDFNLEARYPDYKMKFYKIATKEFTTDNFNKIKDMYLWLKSQAM